MSTLNMIKEKVKLDLNQPVLEQILHFHNLTYKEFSKKLNLSDRNLRRFRSGASDLRLSMQQIKIVSDLLEPFEITIKDLPNDWIVEKRKYK